MRGPIEGWVAILGERVYTVKGCEHPLPCLHVAGKRVAERKVDPFEPLEPRRWSRCLSAFATMICPWDDALLLDPVAGLESLMDSGWRDPVAEALYSVVAGRVGVTGSMLYSGYARVKPRDVDLVVYGAGASREALGVILELFARGVASPVGASEYMAVRREVEPGDWAYLASRNPLLFEAGGRVYSVKLVTCTRPSPCPEPISRQPVSTAVVLEERIGTPCTIPGVYNGRVRGGGRIQVYTLRSSLACIPRYTRLSGVFTLEVYRWFSRLVPDGGLIRVQVLQG